MTWIRSAAADAQSKLDAVGAVWSERDVWRWIKFVKHGLPQFAKCVLYGATKRLGRAPADWDEMRSTANTLTYDEINQGAADPSDNGCTWLRDWMASHGAMTVGDLGDPGNAWANAEEMDLLGDLSAPQQVIASVLGPIEDIIIDQTTNDTPLSWLEIGLCGLAGLAGLYAAIRFDRWLGHGKSG